MGFGVWSLGVGGWGLGWSGLLFARVQEDCMGDEERCKAEGVCKGGPQRCKAVEG